ncbi:NACHT C-terminal helical domain 2-containing protein, partial [Coleofasciculus sp. E1-EBD-02]|uniref:NACHT C-terminal helical domain 2-containing protein n=1 Tax=Coleofasciculus sp. E1-EBD-02 TaxID=3068481 RepID=UPI0032F87664
LVFFLLDLNENEKFFIKLHLIRPLTTVVSTHFLMLYPHRDYWTGALGNSWQPNQKQKEILQNYYDANKILIDCLNSSASVSNEIRREIEETLLLPIAEIEKRKREKAE